MTIIRAGVDMVMDQAPESDTKGFFVDDNLASGPLDHVRREIKCIRTLMSETQNTLFGDYQPHLRDTHTSHSL